MEKLPFEGAQSWKERVIDADQIWQQIQNIVSGSGHEVPKTLRRPDVRLIINNQSGVDAVFRNPGDHSNKAEHIPCKGENTAAMVMVSGETLEEQYRNAQTLYDTFDLGTVGLNAKFVLALIADQAGGLVKEAYGPAPFEGQAKKIVDLTWADAEGQPLEVKKQGTSAAVFGVRPPTEETALGIRVHILFKGTNTVPEASEGTSMVIAVDGVKTRPIVPSVAKEFYGEHYNELPVAVIDPAGAVLAVKLSQDVTLEPAWLKEQNIALGL